MILYKGASKTLCNCLKSWKCTTESEFHCKWRLLLIAMYNTGSSIIINIHCPRYLINRKNAAGDRQTPEGIYGNTLSSPYFLLQFSINWQLLYKMKSINYLFKIPDISTYKWKGLLDVCLKENSKSWEVHKICLHRNGRNKTVIIYSYLHIKIF